MLVSGIVFVLGLAFLLAVLYRYFDRQLVNELERQSSYLAQGVELLGEEYLQEFHEKDARITYISGNGKVLYDSAADAETMDDHSNREEVKEALETGSGTSVRMSGTLSEKTVYYARKLNNGNILRVSSTQYSVLTLVLQLVQPCLWILLLMMVLSGIFAFRVSKRIVEPINALDLEHPEENRVYEEVEPLLSKIHRQNRQIQEQLDSARQQQEEFSVITENMQEGLLVIDRYTRILSGNSSTWNIFKTKEVQNGQSVYSLNRGENFRQAVEKVLEGKHESSLLKIDGGFVQMIANPVVRGSNPVGAVLLFMNVTEKVEWENLRREFSANVSHELKTPLTSISGFAELIQGGFVREEDVKEFAGRIYNEAQHLIQLVEDTIKISQLDEGGISYEREMVELRAMSRNIFTTLKDTAGKKNVSLYIDGEPIFCNTVKTVMEEILYNLCDNAVKYNREGGSVSIALRQTETDISIKVTDNGIGIPKEDQNRVFERFYRVDKSHSKEIGGTGLGLSIVKHGVAFLGGSMELVSEEGKGTEVTVVFPKERG
ncbi:MAG: ATP-binding protein [Eubacteriales bacterium]|nr:ATP-binding protein [Eubacteriales bacterium]